MDNCNNCKTTKQENTLKKEKKSKFVAPKIEEFKTFLSCMDDM